MELQTELDWNAYRQGHINRDNGMRVAILNTDSKIEHWSDYARILFNKFLEQYPDREFIAEEVREFATYHGLGDPPNNKSWGWIVFEASRKGLIVSTGSWREGKNPISHGRPQRCWRKK